MELGPLSNLHPKEGDAGEKIDPWFRGDARHLFSYVLTSEEPQLLRSLHLTPLLLSYQ